jgi:hypothetical protein
MKLEINCFECNFKYLGVENDDLMCKEYTLEENQENFHNYECFNHSLVMFNKYEKIINTKNYTKEQENNYKTYRDSISKTEYNCGNQNENDCEFKGNLAQILKHEITCMGLKPIDLEVEKEKEIGIIKCDLCNKKYMDYPNRKMDIRHQLTAHKRICQKSYKKKRQRLVIEFLKICDDQSIIDNIFETYKDIIE